MAKAINIDHSKIEFSTSNLACIKVSENGSIKIGSGKNLEEDLIYSPIEDFIGAIRLNKSTKKLQYCDGEKWVDFIIDEQDIEPYMAYSFLF